MAAAGFKLYHYDPSLAAAVIFIALFLLSTALHTYQFSRTRTWYLIPFVVGGYFEWLGYTGRAVSSQQTPDWTLGPYIVQSLLILLAPAFFAASIYMELGRIIQLVGGEHLSIIRRTRLTKIFVCGDVFSFLVQSTGGAIMSLKTQSAYKLGQNLVLGGLVIQILFFGFFMVVALSFDRAIRSHPTAHTLAGGSPWHKHLNALYTASVLIMIRSIFRVAEYAQGFDGALLGHEYYLYIFDAVLMLAVMVLFNIVHPSEIKAMLCGGKLYKGGFKLVTIESRGEGLSRA